MHKYCKLKRRIANSSDSVGKARYINKEGPDGLELGETLHPLDPKLSLFDRMKRSR